MYANPMRSELGPALGADQSLKLPETKAVSQMQIPNTTKNSQILNRGPKILENNSTIPSLSRKKNALE